MLTRDLCRRVLHKALSTGADYAEIFAENTENHAIHMIASKVDSMVIRQPVPVVLDKIVR